jgi:outer membrane murein-binding lipoprotein Lpp
MTRSRSWWMPVVLAAVCVGGCEADREQQLRLEQQRDQAAAEAKTLKAEVEKLSAQIQQQNQQIQTLQALGEKRLDRLFLVQKIEIERHSGAVDLDKQPGQDAMKVFLSPIDRDGHTIKTAGDVKIQLFDLAEPEGKNLYAEYAYDVDQIGKSWSGGLFGGHFTFECRWPDGRPPKHDQITIRAEFTDYLTGKTFTDQKVVKVALPPKEGEK